MAYTESSVYTATQIFSCRLWTAAFSYFQIPVSYWIFRALLSNSRGHAVAQLVETLPDGRGFDFRWCHWNFSLTSTFRPHYGPGVDSASNRNEYQVRRTDNLTTFMYRLSWNLGVSDSWNPQGLPRPVQGLLYLILTVALGGDEESTSDSKAIEYEVNWCSELVLKWRQIEESAPQLYSLYRAINCLLHSHLWLFKYKAYEGEPSLLAGIRCRLWRL